MSDGMHCFFGDTTLLIVPLDTDGATGAIASSVSIIVVSTLMIIAMVLCLIRDQRGHTRRMRVSTSVIDICRPVRSDVNRDDSCMAEPQRPREAHLSSRTPTACSPEFLTSSLIAPFQSSAALPQYPRSPKIRGQFLAN